MKSYVRFSLLGGFCEKCLSDAINNGIKVFEVENINGIIYAKTPPQQYKKISHYAKKYRVRMRIEEKKGTMIRLMPYQNRYGILFGVIAYSLIILCFSGMVWDIQIIGNSSIPDSVLLQSLEENGIYPGASNNSLPTVVSELKALLSIDKLAWISVENEGARVYVKVNERLDIAEKTIPVNIPCNVVAARAGQIVRTEVYRGKLMYPVGSGVAQGDVIVSGIVNDGGGNVSVQHADALIIARYEDNVNFYQTFTSTENVKNGNVNEQRYYQLFSFVFPSEKVEFRESSLYSTDRYSNYIFGVKMPWDTLVVRETETEPLVVTRTVDDVKRLLLQQLEAYEANFLTDCEIIERNIEYERTEEGITLNCSYILESNIAVQNEIYLNE